MKKILFLVFTLFLTNFIYSQVALDQTVGNLYKTIVFANGTDSYSIVGSNNRNSLNSETEGTIAGPWLPGTTDTVSSFTSSITTSSTLNFELVGNTNINWDANTVYKNTLTLNSNSYNMNLTFERKYALADTNGDGQYDAHYTGFEMISDPITNPIPVGTIIGFRTPVIKNAINSLTLLSNKTQFKIWTGTQWEETTTTPSGATNLGIAPWVSNPLSVIEYEKNDNISLFPNPTNNFLTIKKQKNSTESFEYKIVDLTGRIVKNGNSKFNEQINIESLTSGNYIIQIQTDSNQFITQKILKN